jgi:hypothetical protein
MVANPELTESDCREDASKMWGDATEINERWKFGDAANLKDLH